MKKNNLIMVKALSLSLATMVLTLSMNLTAFASTVTTKNNDKSKIISTSITTENTDGTKGQDIVYMDGSRKIIISSGNKEDVFTYDKENDIIKENGVTIDLSKIVTENKIDNTANGNLIISPNGTSSIIWNYYGSFTRDFSLAGLSVSSAIAVLSFQLGIAYANAQSTIGKWGANVLGTSLVLAGTIIPYYVSQLTMSASQYSDSNDITYWLEIGNWYYNGVEFDSYRWNFYSSKPL